ncbi:MAG TPA: hypothetical protein ENG80_04210 [Nitrospirae bacterium]|nr:hypothetical protein [Nitrospirota bacterium]
MDFPPEYVAKTLSGFSVCYFKNEEHLPDAPPHYHITIPINDDSSLLLTVITSQIENRLKYYERTKKKALSSLVTVSKKDLKFLKKTSIVECNQPQLVRKIDFNKIVDPDHEFKVVARDIPDELKEEIIQAIKESPIVKPFIKKMVKWP